MDPIPFYYTLFRSKKDCYISIMFTKNDRKINYNDENDFKREFKIILKYQHEIA